MKSYVVLLAFITVGTWLSCASVIKSQRTTHPEVSFSAEASVPSSQLNFTDRYNPSPDVRYVPSTKRATLIPSPVSLSKPLQECRVILDTVASLNESTLKMLTETSKH